jgi:hypothetical protein
VSHHLRFRKNGRGHSSFAKAQRAIVYDDFTAQMEVNGPRQIKNALQGCIDSGIEFDDGHAISSIISAEQ